MTPSNLTWNLIQLETMTVKIFRIKKSQLKFQLKLELNQYEDKNLYFFQLYTQFLQQRTLILVLIQVGRTSQVHSQKRANYAICSSHLANLRNMFL